jgi:hypothetical protein
MLVLSYTLAEITMNPVPESLSTVKVFSVPPVKLSLNSPLVMRFSLDFDV